MTKDVFDDGSRGNAHRAEPSESGSGSKHHELGSTSGANQVDASGAGMTTQEDEHDLLVGHVTSLETSDRIILMLSYAEALTNQEIAQVLDLEEPYVVQRLNALKESARRALQARRGSTSAIRA